MYESMTNKSFVRIFKQYVAIHSAHVYLYNAVFTFFKPNTLAGNSISDKVHTEYRGFNVLKD